MRMFKSIHGAAIGVVLAAGAAALLGAAPAAFTQEPVAVAVSAGNLLGTLRIPAGRGPFPVALIIAGSGPTDRDGNSPRMGLKTDAYKKLAQGLAARGIATLRYDKRASGTSTNSKTESDLRFDDYVNDALAVAKRLESDKRFSSVSIVGHSEGALIGMVASAQDPHVRAFVSLEGAGRDLATIVDEQVSASGASQTIVDEVATINASLLAGKTVPSPDPQLAALFRPSVQPYLISEYRHDPAVDIAKLTIPTLIVQGTTDIQVGVADARRLAAAAPKAHLVIVDGMNHILRDAPIDRAQNVATYGNPALPLDATLVPAIADFILAASAGH